MPPGSTHTVTDVNGSNGAKATSVATEWLDGRDGQEFCLIWFVRIEFASGSN